MNKESIWAVIAGVPVIIVVTTLVDIVLHAVGVFPPMNQPISDALAAGQAHEARHDAWLCWRGPGACGRCGNLEPAAWTEVVPRLLVVLAIPQCWAGGRIYED